MLGRLEAKITLDTARSFDLEGVQVTVPAGQYYWTGAGGLFAALANALDGDAPAFAPWSVTEAGGRITVASGAGGTWDLAWTDGDLRDLLGFDADLISQISAEGALHLPGLFLPNAPYRSLNGGGSWRGTIESDLSQTITASGQVYSMLSGTRRRNPIEWRGLARNKTWQVNEALANESLETFYLDAILGTKWWGAAGGPVLWFPDEGDLATSNEYSVVSADKYAPQQLQQNFTGYWIAQLDLVEVPV